MPGALTLTLLPSAIINRGAVCNLFSAWNLVAGVMDFIARVSQRARDRVAYDAFNIYSLERKHSLGKNVLAFLFGCLKMDHRDIYIFFFKDSPCLRLGSYSIRI